MNVSEREVEALLVDSVTLVVDMDAAETVVVASEPSEAVETPLLVVAVETVTGTEVESVVTGLKVKRPILFPPGSVK